MNRADRKAQLAEAVWQVILEHGIAAVSVRTVAEQAGVVVGSLRHVFPTRAELVQYSAELMVQRATERVLATPFQEDPAEHVLAIIKNLLPLVPDSRAEMEVNLALAAEATALPSLIPVRDEAHQQIAALCVKLVRTLTDSPANSNARDPEHPTLAAAQRLHAMIDGFAFHLLHRPPTEDPAWAIDILRAEVVQIRDHRRSNS